ncbi:hypothetical protein TSOC_005593 [Tetrabaena socialis]|uniref:Uncharacterized protein n=1 Tax=Tetrabaena socialis TaxID=47790 RepID=A0A2J8A5U5_9CHLO|nr:hypothetical protein TSOC_005593 [Tetrabaena socialis]|eukprot:PNH07901.1 hypothetical protein TSOC_005593 [Tetrabaena socialis]
MTRHLGVPPGPVQLMASLCPSRQCDTWHSRQQYQAAPHLAHDCSRASASLSPARRVQALKEQALQAGQHPACQRDRQCGGRCGRQRLVCKDGRTGQQQSQSRRCLWSMAAAASCQHATPAAGARTGAYASSCCRSRAKAAPNERTVMVSIESRGSTTRRPSSGASCGGSCPAARGCACAAQTSPDFIARRMSRSRVVAVASGPTGGRSGPMHRADSKANAGGPSSSDTCPDAYGLISFSVALLSVTRMAASQQPRPVLQHQAVVQRLRQFAALASPPHPLRFGRPLGAVLHVSRHQHCDAQPDEGADQSGAHSTFQDGGDRSHVCIGIFLGWPPDVLYGPEKVSKLISIGVVRRKSETSRSRQ